MSFRTIAPRVWQKAKASRALLALADKMELRMKREFLAAVEAMRSSVDLAALERAIEHNDQRAAFNAATHGHWQEQLADTAQVPTRMYQQAGTIAAEQLGKELKLQIAFETTNARAARWAVHYGSTLIKEIVEQQRAGVREVVSQAFLLGRDTRSTARIIKQSVGLLDKQVIAVGRYRTRLTNEGRPADQVDRMADKYSRKLLTSRSETIARTEIMSAGHAGQHEMWNQAIDKGLINPSRTWRVWVLTDDDRLCDVCAAMEGQTVPYDGTFTDGDGNSLATPPVHPNCRCDVALTFNDPD